MAALARGKAAEAIARQYLKTQGLRHVDSNVRCRFGEIDLVMTDDRTLVFVEVRLRKQGNLLTAAESVDSRKQRKLAITALWYIGQHQQFQSSPVRFDVIAIDGQADDRSALQWIRDAFRPGA